MATKAGPVLPVKQKDLEGSVFEVGSESVPGQTYDVDLAGPTCTCEARTLVCKHVKAARVYHQNAQQQLAMELNGFGVERTNGATRDRAPSASRLDKMGYVFGEVTSAMQKEIRNSDEEAAVYWGLLLYDASPQYAWKRVLISAAEDVGLAAPETVALVCGLGQAWAFCKQNSWNVDPQHIVMAIAALCRASKSTEVDDLKNVTLESQKHLPPRPIPAYALDVHTKSGRANGASLRDWYRDRHVTFGIPVNKWTERVWELDPDARPDLSLKEEPL